MNVIDDKRRTGRTTEMIRAAVDDTFHERNVIVIMSSKRECDHWRQVISGSGMAESDRIHWFTPDSVERAHGLIVDEVHIDHFVLERYEQLTEPQRAGIALLQQAANAVE